MKTLGAQNYCTFNNFLFFDLTGWGLRNGVAALVSEVATLPTAVRDASGSTLA